jgi:hypothetical protein
MKISGFARAFLITPLIRVLNPDVIAKFYRMGWRGAKALPRFVDGW